MRKQGVMQANENLYKFICDFYLHETKNKDGINHQEKTNVISNGTLNQKQRARESFDDSVYIGSVLVIKMEREFYQKQQAKENLNKSVNNQLMLSFWWIKKFIWPTSLPLEKSKMSPSEKKHKSFLLKYMYLTRKFRLISKYTNNSGHLGG